METYRRPGREDDDGLQVRQEQPGLEHGLLVYKNTSNSNKELVSHEKYSTEFGTEPEKGRSPTPSRTSRNPFGLSPLLYGILVALITSTVLGAALGGGLGSAIMSSHRSSSSGAATVTATATVTETASGTGAAAASSTSFSFISSSNFLTDYQVAHPAQVYSVPYDCPSLSSQTYITAQEDTYSFTCYEDYQCCDIVSLIAYKVEDCAAACSAMNFDQHGTVCTAFTFNANMSYVYNNGEPKGGNNCWLKNGTTEGTPSQSSELLIVSGRLTS